MEGSISSIGRPASVTVVQTLVVALLSCGLAFGQSFTASVVGRVEDAAGYFLPRASVTITDIDRGTSQTTLADEAGRFSITALPPGQC
jgi:Carboxypeptidase regulatory-like domain